MEHYISNGVNPDKRTGKRKSGDIGENIACNFLKRRGFEILERNYSKKWGEIDIVTKRAGLIHFIEVKSVTRLASIRRSGQATASRGWHMPLVNTGPKIICIRGN